MELILISAMSDARVIGRGDGLPWEIPEEYAHFLAQVRDHPIVMGRRSYEIFGADLIASPMLVVSRTLASAVGANMRVCTSLEEALRQASTLDERVFVAGGARVYAETLPQADALYLSIVRGDYEGDTYFPAFDEAQWEITRRDHHERFEFRIYERR
ncbi:MAG: dihydrofolate reductase [Pseudomonadota bacterium]